MPPTIQVLNGKQVGKKFELTQDQLRMGRHPDCEIPIDLNSVSRFHAHITKSGGDYVIEDLDSRNGTFVNGRKIEGPTALNDNDRIKICDILFVYRTLAQVQPTPTINAVEDEGKSTVVSTLDANDSKPGTIVVQAEAKLRAIIDISQAIGQTLDPDLLFPKILDSLFKIFPQADRGLIILLDGEGNLVPRCTRHRRGNEDTVRFSKTIVQQAMAQKQAILSADASSDDRFSMAQSIADFRIRSIMCVPLLGATQKALGVLQLDTQSYHQQFNMEDLQILVSVASQAAIAVENAEMHSEILDQTRIQRELAFAREVQAGFLPHSMPKFAGYNFWAYYEAAGMVGGDYYDFLKLPNGRQAVIVGDVSGKGVPAALFMAKVTSDTRVALLTNPDDPAAAMAAINNSVCEAAIPDKFITLALCVIDPVSHVMTIVNAGHMSPVIRRADGSLEEPAGEKITGLPIGVMEDFSYESIDVELAEKNDVVLYSDGINEAMNAHQQQYTTDKLRAKVKALNVAPPQLGEAIVRDVREHVAGYKQSDDMTLVVFARGK